MLVFFLLVLLRIEVRASHKLGRHSQNHIPKPLKGTFLCTIEMGIRAGFAFGYEMQLLPHWKVSCGVSN